MFFNFISFRFSYVVSKGKYLIKNKPTRPTNGYNRYIKFMTSGTNESIVQTVQQSAKKWKKFSKAEKAAYKTSDAEMLKYKKQIKEYEAMYVLPFKNVTFVSLLTKQISQSQKDSSRNFKMYIQCIKERFSKIKPEEKQALIMKVNQIKAERAKLAEKLKIPLDEYNGSLARFVKKTKAVSIKKLKQPQVEECTKQYRQYLANKKRQFQKFALNHELTPAQLQALIKADAKTTEKNKKAKNKSNDEKKETEQEVKPA